MIKSSDDANKYYSLIDSHIESYVNNYYSKYGVEPRKIEEHLLKNKNLMDDFLKKRGLFDVSGINRIVQDVLEDRIALHKDSVMTFESFSLLESVDYKINSLKECLYLGISEVTVEHEKLLADLFDCSLSHVECVSPDRRIFRVDSEDLESVVIYLENELEIVHSNMINYFVTELMGNSVSFQNLSFGVFGDFCDESQIIKLVSEKFSLDDCKSKICELLHGRDLKTSKGLVVEL